MIWSHLEIVPVLNPFPVSHVPVRQGEMVDCIEYCVNQTGDHVGQARGELIKAEEYQSKARKVKNIRHTRHADDRTRAETEMKICCPWWRIIARWIARNEKTCREGRADFHEFRIDSVDMNAANSQSRLERNLLTFIRLSIYRSVHMMRCT